MERRIKIERGDHTLEVVNQRFDAVGAADLLRQAEAALIVSEHAKVVDQVGNDAVPGIERTADFV